MDKKNTVVKIHQHTHSEGKITGNTVSSRREYNNGGREMTLASD